MFELENDIGVPVVVPAAGVASLPEGRLQGEAEPVFGKLRAGAAPAVIVDLAAVPYFGSPFISVLIRMHKIVRQKGGEILLAGAGDRVHEVLHLTGLNKLWASYASRERALASLSENAACTTAPST
jgi:anti-sigma B factor antagonist